jgi:hypothetical protein
MNFQHGVPAWHTAAEMQLYSNFAHSVEGLIVLAAGVLALVQAQRGLRQRHVWPVLVLVAGGFLGTVLLLPWHGPAMADDQWAFVFNDPQQRQHLLIALLLVLGGSGELARRRYPAGWLRGILPLVLLGLGAVFLLHQQHGDSAAVARAVLVHQCLGAVFAMAGLASLISEFKPAARWAAMTWPLALILAGLLLFTYREPSGAYHPPATYEPHGSRTRHRVLPGQALHDGTVADQTIPRALAL